MTFPKPQLTVDYVAEFVKEHNSILTDTSEIVLISSGETSQAFEVGNFILRFNTGTDEGFKKEQYIHENYLEFPTPEILDVGKYKEYFYAISRKIEGTQLHKIDAEQMESILPDLFAVMNRMHASPVNSAWGELSIEKLLMRERWQEFARDHDYFKIDYLNKLWAEAQTLLEYIPQEKYFLHGDFGSTNVIAVNE